MNARTEMIMKAREAGRAGLLCPVAKGDTSPDGLSAFHAWLLATAQAETDAPIMPEFAESEHPDLQLCRPKKEATL